ncbi:DUF5677 domain-containing protein [Dyella sp.]|uniref:DUF5677 domain-containing protein n=1 Tax=Dyella sp. TaxID=1869338 RepID=UPI002D789EE9|nr:DUF5677 domain-containing protein [Dyella sp.]HET6432357.1 DUF5677 domain-containing protein [Dyella sp.]
MLADISATPIDPDAIEQFTSESDYVSLALDLLIETDSYVCVAANIYKNENGVWSRDEAVLGGHLVRLYKLIDSLLDQTCKHRREMSIVLARLIFECIVNLRYLIANASYETFRSYRIYSLQHELKLIETIEENIAARNGLVLPIEDRMIKSILSSFRASDLTRDDVSGNKQRNWNGLNLYERARRVGLDQAYLAVFGGGSHSIHGNWQDLLEYHLEKLDDHSYRANMGWRRPRPQLLEALVTLTCEALFDYLRFVSLPDEHELFERLDDLGHRTQNLSDLHEKFLVNRRRNA